MHYLASPLNHLAIVIVLVSLFGWLTTISPETHATILGHDNIVVNDLTIRDKNFPVLEVIKMMSSMEAESLS